jgi:cobalt-zinc-cadmium efflux system outer membrane protein
MTLMMALVIGVCVPSLATAQDARSQETSAQETSAQDVGAPRTLEQLYDYALQNAPELLEARERVGLGQAAVEGATRFQQHNPEIEGEVGVGLGEGEVSKLEVKLKQRLEVAGERGLRVDAARLQKQALEAQADQAEWQVLQQVRRLYRTGLLDRQRVDIEQQSLEFTQELLDIAEQRFEAGEEARTSVIVSKAERAKARQRLAQARIAYLRTLRTLGANVGWQEDSPPQPTGELDAPTRPASKEALLELAFANDPQLTVLDSQLQQARAELALAEREVWPDPIVGIGYERESAGAGAAEHKLLFVLGASLPVWNQNQGEVAEATARINVFRQAVESRKRVLESLVLEQNEAVESAYEQARIYEEEVLPALETQLELLQEGFRLGELSLLDVMNARDRLLEVQRQHLSALNQYYTAVSELERLLGTSTGQEDTENIEDTGDSQ